MLNPYEPPRTSEQSDVSWWLRLRVGFARAAAAYREGLKQEGLTPWQHFRAWLTLLLLLAFLGLTLLLLVYLGFAFGLRTLV